ncbi:MAG: sodium-dependent transporter [Bacteroidales bacterium]|nr:sodium-dependent transporter [Bacteroidales bacterium]
MKDRGNFASKIGIILATAGSSVGLGNIWRFPVETGQNGGAAFIIIYLACVVFLGVPMMTAEFIIGRRTHTDIASAYEQLAWSTDKRAVSETTGNGRRRFSPWAMTGYAGMVCVTLILSYYSVVAGWILKYTTDAITGKIAQVTDANAYFTNFSSSTWAPLAFTIVFLMLTHIIIMRGIQNGIERVSKILMPLLFVLMLMLAVGALTMPGAMDGVRFLLHPDFSKITSDVVLSALGQAFFSLSIAIGCLATYASYFKADVNLIKTSANVVGIDTVVAILSGFIIFPAVFSVPGVTPDAGPGLVFVTLPNIFNSLFVNMPLLGYIFSLMFYGLLVLAALTSTISMHEEVTAFFVDRYSLTRRRAATYMTLTCAVLTALCSLSFGPLSGFKPFFGRGFFDAFNDVTALWIMPLSGIVMSLFVGWRLPNKLVIDELTNHHTLRFPRWLFVGFFFLIRWVAPIAIAFIFVNELMR